MDLKQLTSGLSEGAKELLKLAASGPQYTRRTESAAGKVMSETQSGFRPSDNTDEAVLAALQGHDLVRPSDPEDGTYVVTDRGRQVGMALKTEDLLDQ